MIQTVEATGLEKRDKFHSKQSQKQAMGYQITTITTTAPVINDPGKCCVYGGHILIVDEMLDSTADKL